MHASAAPPQPPDKSVVPGLAEVSADTLFDLIGHSDLIEKGQAFLVSLAPVKEALGARWEPRRNQIYELVERHARKHLSPSDIWEQASETQFLVATPDTPPVLAQALCYRTLRDVLTYFLGDVNRKDLHVSQVTELTATQVGVRPVSAVELERADAESIPRPTLPAVPSSLTELNAWPLKSADGQDLRVSFAVDPVMDLKSWAMAGHRIESRIMNLQTGVELTSLQRRSLLPRDFEKIDLAALERGMSRLSTAAIPDKPNMIIQLSFASLSNGRARAALLSRAREMQHVLRHAAICELVDVENGVPVGRLTEVTSLIRGFFRSVWVQVELERTLVDAAAGAKTSGVSVRAPDLGDDGEAIARGMKRFVAMVTRPNTLMTVTNLPSTDLMIDAHAVGFSHATLRVRSSATPEAKVPTPAFV